MYGGRTSLRKQGGEGRDSFCLAQHEDLLDLRTSGGFLRLVHELRDREEVSSRGIAQLERQLIDLVERVDGGDDPSRAYHAMERNGIFGEVRRVDREHISLAEVAAARPEASPSTEATNSW
jgi:hypothetical protein